MILIPKPILRNPDWRGVLDGIWETWRASRYLKRGSGAGRFTEILLKHGAVVHSFDFSNAAEANRSNNGASDRLTLVQADIRAMPFQQGYYDYVICLGVIQHTPNSEESIHYLWQMVKPGGYLVIDHYLFKWQNKPPHLLVVQSFCTENTYWRYLSTSD